MGGVRIREGQPRDDPACLEVIRRAFATVADDSGFRADTHPLFPAYWTPERFAAARARDGLLLVAERDDTIVGCCFAGASRHDPASWHLKRLAVLPEARHRGLGADLVNAAISRATAVEGGSVRLHMVASNQRLAAWYLALGFRLVATTTPPGFPFEIAEFELPLTAAKAGYAIRPATAEDGEWLRALHAAAYAALSDRLYDERADAWQRGFFSARIAHPADIFVVSNEGTDVGALYLEDRAGCLFVERLEVLPDRQGRGAGSWALKWAVDRAAEQGRTVTLQVHKVNTRARSLYERLGFSVTGETSTHHKLSASRS